MVTTPTDPGASPARAAACTNRAAAPSAARAMARRAPGRAHGGKSAGAAADGGEGARRARFVREGAGGVRGRARVSADGGESAGAAADGGEGARRAAGRGSCGTGARAVCVCLWARVRWLGSQKPILCRVPAIWHTAKIFFIFFNYFAVCL